VPLRLHQSDDDFAARFSALVDAERAADADVGGAVAEIVASVRDQGDAALLAYTERFDGHALSAADLRVDAAEIAAARQQVRGEAMPQGMRRCSLRQSQALSQSMNPVLNQTRSQPFATPPDEQRAVVRKLLRTVSQVVIDRVRDHGQNWDNPFLATLPSYPKGRSCNARGVPTIERQRLGHPQAAPVQQ